MRRHTGGVIAAPQKQPKEKPILKASRVIRELLPPPLLARLRGEKFTKTEVKMSKRSVFNKSDQDQHLN